MNSYRYKVTVEALTGAKGEPVEGLSLTFETANHDDILGIAERLQNGLPFAADESAALAIGPVNWVNRCSSATTSTRRKARRKVDSLGKAPRSGCSRTSNMVACSATQVAMPWPLRSPLAKALQINVSNNVQEYCLPRALRGSGTSLSASISVLECGSSIW